MSESGKPLFVPLASEPFYLFLDRKKKVEVRRFGPRWNERTVWEGRPVLLRRGYSTQDQIFGYVGKVEVVPSWAFLSQRAKEASAVKYPEHAHFFDKDKPILAFEVIW